jgi:thiol reductant ABC exporter CydC subunit
MTAAGTVPLLRLRASGTPAAGRLRLGVVLTAGSFIAGVGLTATAAWLIARAAQMPPVLSLGVAVVAVRAFGITRPVLRYLGRLASHDGALRLTAALRVTIYERLIPLVPGRTGGPHRGAVLAGVVTDSEAGQDLHLRIVEPAAVAALVSACSVAFATVLLPSAGAVLLVGVVVAAVAAPVAAAAAAGRVAQTIAPLRAELTAATLDLLHGAADLIALGAAGRALAAIDDRDAALTRATRRAAWATGAGAGLSVLAAGATVWASTVVGIPAVRQGTISGVTLAVVVLLPLAVFESLAPLPSAAVLVGTVRSAARSLFALVDQKPAVREPAQPVAPPPGPYTLRLRGVAAAWPGTRRRVFAGVDLDLPPGAHVAVTGRSGSGKTTLAMLLLRFVDPDSSGTILLNDVDIQEMAADDVRRVIGYVADDAHVFDSDLRENLRLARPAASDDELVSALLRVRLGDWYAGLPQGLSTPLGTNGALVSGGERRRIALARALLADRPILVLDEPTESLDAPTAAALVADLLDAADDRTVVVLTHRLDGLDRVHRQLVLTPSGLVEATG